MSQHQTNAVAVAEMGNRNKVFNLALQGFSVQGIVEQTGLSDTSVKAILADYRAELSLRLQEAQESWIGVALARTEKIISKLMPVFDAPIPSITDETDDGRLRLRNYTGLIGEAAKAFTNVAKFQKELLQLKIEAPASSTNPNIVQNNTFIADSDFYHEALQAIQIERAGRTFDEYMEEANAIVDVIPTLDDDPRISKIEATIDKLLPSNASSDDDTDRE